MVFASERLKGPALECYDVAARLDPRQPKWPYRQAVTLAQTGALEPAIAAMERSIALEPGYPPSHARLGGYRLEGGDLEGAERAFRRATELDSTYPGGWVGLARVALQRDRPEEAVAILERLLQQDAEDRTFRQLHSTALRQAGRAEGLTAESVLGEDELPVWNDPWELEARAFRQRPTMLRIGRLLEAGDAAQALELLEEERAHGADPFETALTFVDAYLQLGRRADALAELEALLAREPDNTAALLMQARILGELDQPEQAVAALERVTALQPAHGGAFAAKGRLLITLRQHERATEALRRALELGVGDYELRYSLGTCLIVLKRWSEAREVFTALTAERAGHGDAWLELAIARLRSGELEGAEEALARAQAAGNASPRLLADVQQSLRGARERRAQRPGGADGSEGEDP
jgi:tetratricopeptide (TPR) repeat protein